MNKMNIQKSVIGLLLVFACTSLAEAQQVDYESFPQIDADYHHLDLTLELVDDSRLNGLAEYTLTLMRDGIEELRLDAVRMNIEEVIWDGGPAEYRVDDDQLVVLLPGGLDQGASYELGIQYRADPVFGVHRSETGSVWSSGLPGSVRHWLPVVDHARNRFSLDVNLIFSVDKTALFSGVPGDEGAESVDLKRVRFYSDTDYPASSLRFAIGLFDEEEITFGRHRITLFAEEGLLEEEKRNDLLQQARADIERSAALFGINYPSRSLHLVVLEDDRWEVKPYGAGVTFAFTSRGDLSRQLRAGIMAQWAGVQIHEESWERADGLLLLQAWYLNRLNDDLPLENVETDIRKIVPEFPRDSHYWIFSDLSRMAWMRWLNDRDQASVANWMSEYEDEIPGVLSSVISWYDIASRIHESTGLSIMEPPILELPEEEEEEPIARYRVVFDFDPGAEELSLQFTSLENELDERVTIYGHEIGFNGSTTHEMTLTGAEEVVTLDVDAVIENLILETDHNRLELEEEKPFDFWFHQLRSEEDATRRAQAATGLQAYSDNPDLQLALLDLMGNESDQNAFAEMIRALAAVTDGSSGTNQLFLDRYSSDQDPVVQEAIMEALGNYPGNSSVISRLQSTILNGEHYEVRIQAIRSLARVTETEEFLGRSEALLSRERTIPVAEPLLRQIAETGQEEDAIRLADEFLIGSYPWTIRKSMIEFLLDLDRDRERWLNRIETYASDNDPRMRFIVLRGLEMLPGSDHEDILDERGYEEYDDRIRRRIEMMQ